jgi:hypothetical protein
MKQGVLEISIKEFAVAYAYARDGERGGCDGGSECRFGGGGYAWGYCPARGDGGKVREDGTGRYRNGNPKSKKEADVFHPVFILVKDKGVKLGPIRIVCVILRRVDS